MGKQEVNLFVVRGFLPRIYEVHDNMIRIKDPVFSWEFTCEKVGLSREQVIEGLQKIQDGGMVQDAFPTLTPDQRESFVTCPDAWEELEADTDK